MTDYEAQLVAVYTDALALGVTVACLLCFVLGQQIVKALW